ncbi:hypothetical protein Taro_035913 [Colocasia esculenta]|uniref:Uncharacterized protein n=1 Tax=Colocasia esculenta TaxID=4460 RepID=A0A843W844_COLES|nr:hypothetical protein [Colocasia esculenta]
MHKIFYHSLFSNSELLLHGNVDTFIVFHSAVLILVAAGENLCLDQPWPSPHTYLALLTIFVGGQVYVATDYEFTLVAYGWAVAYLGLILYNNLEALLLFPLELLIMGEIKEMKQGTNVARGSHLGAALPVGLSCLFGWSAEGHRSRAREGGLQGRRRLQDFQPIQQPSKYLKPSRLSTGGIYPPEPQAFTYEV